MTNDITVTLSGNSTPLLPNPFAPAFMGNTQSVPLNGLVEADSRLAIEQGKGLTNSQGAVVLGLLGELRARLAEAEKELAGVLDLIPKDHIVRVREGGGPENVAATVAVSVGRVVHKLAEAEARAGRAEEAVRVLAEEVEKQRHAANEWADTYYNAKQWLKNIAIGISTPAEAFGNLDKCEAHCKEVWDDACKPAARAAVEGAK